jgi:dTDP-4-dehydrorhamnose reductase
MPTLLVTGANGQLGKSLQGLEDQYPAWTMEFASRLVLDITDPPAIRQAFDRFRPDACINAAAYTAVDRAEQEPKTAHKVNVLGTANLAEVCQESDIPLLHISTDYVYHGQQNTPFRESDPTAPQSVYARTKLEGEHVALQFHPLSMVIRTSWVYSQFGHNFLNTMLRLGQERSELNVVYDQIGTPTFAGDLAATCLQIIEQIRLKKVEEKDWHGIFNFSNEGVCSWYDFAIAIFRQRGIDCHVRPIRTEAYPTPAKRPPFSLMDKQKIKQTFQLSIDHWETALQKCLQQP